MIKSKQYFLPTIIFFLSLISTGCQDSDSTNIRDSHNTPEFAAKSYFFAIYEQKDMKLIKKHSTAKMQRLIEGYGSIQGIKRNMLNMHFDQVNIKVEKSNNLRIKYGDEAKLTLIFTGVYNGNNVADFRVVELIKKRGTWLVNKVQHDPYSR